MSDPSKDSAPEDESRDIEDQQEATPEGSATSWWISLLVSLLVLAAAAGLSVYVFMTEPTAKKAGATRKTAMLVEVLRAEKGTYRPTIVAQGTVMPSRDIVLRPQIAGLVVEMGPGFTPGGVVDQGDPILRIQQADYRFALAQRKSALRQAETDLALEEGRHDAAEVEFGYLDGELTPENRALVLREPQLEAAKQRVEAARAAVEQAELDLRRTSIEAPFDAHILRRDVNLGSQVSPGDPLGRLVGIDTYWVGVELPRSKLRRVAIADDDTPGSTVHVRDRRAWGEGASRVGEVVDMVGALDENTRMVRLLAAVPDPLARGPDAEGKPSLLVGAFVEVSIEGVPLEGVVRLDRDYVREDDTVWLMVDGALEVVEVEIAVRDATYAYISKGIDDGAQVVTTNISTVVEGAELRLDDSKGDAASGEDQGRGHE